MGVQISGDTGNVLATKGTYTGNLTVGGVLTYEDVTNVDSVGLVTARSGIEIGARPGVAASISVDGNMIVSGISTFGGAANFAAISGTTGTFSGDVDIADKIVHTGDTNTAIRFPAADTFTVETGGSERVRVTSDGKLALGVTSPVAVVHIEGGSEGNLFQLSNTHTGTTVSDGFVMGINSSATYIFNRENTPIRIGTNNTEALRIDSSGRVLIGTTTEGSGGADELTLATSGDTGMTIRSGTSSAGGIYFSDGTSGGDEYRGVVSYNHSGNYMRFYTDGTEKVRITSGGGLNIGSTGGFDSNGDDLTITNSSHGGISIKTGTTSDGVIRFGDGSGTDEYRGYINYRHDGDKFLIGTSGAQRLSVDSDGLKFGSDTAATNALDDYEEGSWTATVTGTNSNMGSQTGRSFRYTKIGNVVHFTFDFFQTNNNMSVTNVSIAGLPFATLPNSFISNISIGTIQSNGGQFVMKNYMDNGANIHIIDMGTISNIRHFSGQGFYFTTS